MSRDYTINVRYQKSGLAGSRSELSRFSRDLLSLCCAEEQLSPTELTVLFCSEQSIHEMNRTYLQEDHPTDVLSFPAEEEGYLGDLAVCLPVCARNAMENGKELGEEVALLLVHGFLHLLGHDHDNAARKKRMWKRTDQLLAAAAEIDIPSIAVAELYQ